MRVLDLGVRSFGGAVSPVAPAVSTYEAGMLVSSAQQTGDERCEAFKVVFGYETSEWDAVEGECACH